MLKISTIKKKITPSIGTHLAGYGVNVISDGIHDDLFISGIAFDDGETKAILMSFDLLGLDADLVQEIRKECSAVAGISPSNIVLTCTHTHSGPHTRSLAVRLRDEKYAESLVEYCKESVSQAFVGMIGVSVFHYSAQCHENINRRVITPDNRCHYLPFKKHLMPIANGITDPELGMVFLVGEGGKPVATLLNYAAHPLTCQSEGASSLKISSDYPGVLREIVEEEIGGTCVFTNGACGDLHPKGFETGFTRTEQMGKSIAQKVIDCYSDALRNPDLYLLDDTQLDVRLEYAELKLRDSGCLEERLPLYKDKDSEKLEFQLFRLGEICFVGVPGELLCEPGLMIKWNSPFRKTFILYNSTAYISYIAPTNAFVSGGYESETSHLEPFAAFKLVSRIVEEFEEYSPQRH